MTPGSFNWFGIENENPKKLKESSDTKLFSSHRIRVAKQTTVMRALMSSIIQ